MSTITRRWRHRPSLAALGLLLLAAGVAAGAVVVVATPSGASGPAAARAPVVPGVSVVPGVPEPQHYPAAVFLGDSWTAGNDMGGRKDANYSALLGRRNRWYVTNLSYGGTGYLLGAPTENFGSNAHLAALRAAAPDVVFVVNGVNDINAANTPASWGAAAGATFDRIRAAAPHAILVVVGPIPPGDAADVAYFAPWDRALAAAAQARGAVYLDAFTQDWFGGSYAALIGTDHFHPTDAGQRHLADVVEADLVAAGVPARLDAAVGRA